MIIWTNEYSLQELLPVVLKTNKKKLMDYENEYNYLILAIN